MYFTCFSSFLQITATFVPYSAKMVSSAEVTTAEKSYLVDNRYWTLYYIHVSKKILGEAEYF